MSLVKYDSVFALFALGRSCRRLCLVCRQRGSFVGVDVKKFVQSRRSENAHDWWLETTEKYTALLPSRLFVGHNQFAERGTGNELQVREIDYQFRGGIHFDEPAQLLAELKYRTILKDTAEFQFRDDCTFMSRDFEVFWFLHPLPIAAR